MKVLFRSLVGSGAVLFLSLTLAAVSQSGVFMETATRTSGEPGAMVVKSYINPDRVRIEMQDRDADVATIFRADKRLIWSIDQRARTYTEMTEETMAGMGAQMEQAMREMGKQMGQLPPEQRRMMEEMMRAQMQPKPPAKISVRRLASGERVGRFTTDRYEVLEDGVKSSEIWVVPWPSLDLTPQDFRALEELAKMMQKMAGSFQEMVRAYGSDPQIEMQVQGLPVKTVGYRRGRASFEVEVTQIRKEGLVSSLFELSPGLEKQEMPGMPGRPMIR